MLLSLSFARAEQGRPPDPFDLQEPSLALLEPGWLPATAALVPGLLVHGSGHMIGGDVDGGLRLLALQGVGLGLMGAGLAPIFALGASRKVIGPAYAITLTGLGLYAISGAADLYGSLFPDVPSARPSASTLG